MNFFFSYKRLTVDKSFLPIKERLDTLGLVIRDLRELIWFQRAELPVARDGLGAVFANKKIYAIGGRSDFGENSMIQTSDSFVDEYDPNDNTWVSKEKMLYPHTHHAVVAASDGKIYTLGGYIKISVETQNDPQYTVLASMGSISNMLQRYDPVTNQWKLMQAMPLFRVFPGAVATHNGLIFAIGGLGYNFVWPDLNQPPATPPDKYKYLAEVHKYDINTDSWVPVAPMPTARCGLAAVLGNDGLIYAIGGVDDECQRVATVEAYDPVADSWEKKADMPTPRSDLSAVVGSDGNIYAIGGVSEWDSIGTVEVYYPASNTWATGAPLQIDRLCFGATVTDEGMIYVIGGSQHTLNVGMSTRKFLSSVERSGL